MNHIKLILGLVNDLFDLEGRLACHNRTGHNADRTGYKQDLRAVLFDLKARSI